MNKRAQTTYNFIKKHIRSIIELVGIFGVIIALVQLNVQQQQFTFEQQQYATQQAQKPELTYYYETYPFIADISEISTIASDLENEYYSKVYEIKQQSPEKSFHDVMLEVLPLSRDVTSKKYVVEIQIGNHGSTTANLIRVRVETTLNISSATAEANEPYQIVDGGEGKHFVTVEINRLIANDSAKINIELSNDNQTADRIVAFNITDKDNPPELQQSGYSYNIENALIAIGSGGLFGQGYGHGTDVKLRFNGVSNFYVFPDMEYVYSTQPEVRLFVSSNEGNAMQSYIPIITPTP